MEGGGNSQNIEQDKKGIRRTWTKQEEDALVSILEDIVRQGYRYDNGSFKPGTTFIIEKALNNMCPTSGLKANPHIDSKMKVWKKQYSIIFDMLSKNGFRWNDVNKCVEVDSDEVWHSYVQNHKDAKRWRGKPFPVYEKLMNIYGIDRANGKGAETPGDMAKDINRNHVIDNIEEEKEEEEEESSSDGPFSFNHTSSTNSTLSDRRKRKKRADSISDGLGKLVESIDKMIKNSNEQVEKIVRGIVEGDRKREQDQQNFVWEELTRLEIPVDDCVDILNIVAEKPWTANVFKSLADTRKVEFVMSLLKKR